MKILIIRRDNIGDLVCTTPLFSALKNKFPNARVDAFVNSYNQAVLTNNPFIDNTYIYTKIKHKNSGESVIGSYWKRLLLILKLRGVKYDFIILANRSFSQRSFKFARWFSPKNIISFVPENEQHSGISHPIILNPSDLGAHEVMATYKLLAPFGIGANENPPALAVFAEAAARQKALFALQNTFGNANKKPIAIHISARKIPQRWQALRFAALMQALHQKYQCAFLLLWSPGAADNALHPGDDEKAQQIMAATQNLPVCAYPTVELPELIGALATCQAIICSDGGAMHLGAGLGLPIVCFFGNSNPVAWHPWGVPHEVLQKPSLHVDDISVEDALEAFARLKNKANF